MSLFLEIWRYIFWRVEDNRDENENEPLRRRETTIADSVYGFRPTSSSSITYVTVPSYSRPTRESSCNQSPSTSQPKADSTKPSSVSSIPRISSSKPIPQAPKSAICSSSQPQSLKQETHPTILSLKPPVLRNFLSRPIPQTPKVPLSASSDEPSQSLNLLSDAKISAASLPKLSTTEEFSSNITPTQSSSSLGPFQISSKSPTSVNLTATPTSSDLSSQQTKTKDKWVHTPIVSSSKSLPSSTPIPAPASEDGPDEQTTKPSPSFSTTEEFSSKITPTLSSSSSGLFQISSKSPTSANLTATPTSSDLSSQQTKTKVKWVRKNTSPLQESHSNTKPSVKWVRKNTSPLQESRSNTKPSPIVSSSKSLPSSKPIPAPASEDGPDEQTKANRPDQRTKANYVKVKKKSFSIYMIPKNIQDLLEKDEVPEVLKRPLSRSTYKDYFHALLYAEDFYIEKWSDFKLKNVTLKLQEAAISEESYFGESSEKVNRTFVQFKVDSSLEKRPFLLSRDFVFARPSGSNVDPFQGVIYRVVKSTTVLVEFDEDFYHKHYSTREYDVSFSFNRVCLKRAHHAIEAASDVLFRNFIFPDRDFRKSTSSSTPSYYSYKLDAAQMSAVRRILTCQGPLPYLIEGPLRAKNRTSELTRTGLMVKEAVLEIYSISRKHRILLCTPVNSTCDLLTRSLKNHIPEYDMFRANAAFREIDEVPADVLPSCLYQHKDECFCCPQLEQLQKFRVVVSTYVSSFRLAEEGIVAGHFGQFLDLVF